MFRRSLLAIVLVLVFVSSATAVRSAAAKTNKAVVTHRLIVGVEKNQSPASPTKLAVLVLISQSGGDPAGAVATLMKPLTVLLDNGGLYRVKSEIDSACKGSCTASYRISGSVAHELEVVPRCKRRASGFVCSEMKIVKVY